MNSIPNLSWIKFRRQFLLGPEPINLTFWSTFLLPQKLFLSVHPDLPCKSVSNGFTTITLLGRAIDSFSPESEEREIIESRLNHQELENFIESTRSLSGRWVIIFQNRCGTHLFSDPSGFRSIFYYWDGRNPWAASQPELIKSLRPLEFQESPQLWEFLRSPCMSRSESAWVGSQTPYRECHHLLPNHYLDFFGGHQVRFYPNKDLKKKEDPEVVEEGASLLRAIMNGVGSRYGGTFGLTAGWDSRLLLAASREVKENFEFFIDCYGRLTEGDSDVWVFKELTQRLRLRSRVLDSKLDPPGWFNSILAHNVTSPRILPKTRMIYGSFLREETRLNINGNVGEVTRNPMDKYWAGGPEIPTEELVYLMGYWDVPPFVLGELRKWRKDLEAHGLHGLSLLDLLYWEQRLGNWGALYPNEQDISIDEMSPLNCRLLIEILLSSRREIRSYPDHPLHRELIRWMWPEADSIPINPKKKGQT